MLNRPPKPLQLLSKLVFAFAATSILSACATKSGDTRPTVSNANHRVIVFVWDGLRPDSVTQQDTPNLYALKQEGSWFPDHHSTYPTFTMMNAAAFASGAFPGTTGFYGNTLWAPGTPNANDSGNKPQDYSQPIFTEDYAVLDQLNRYYGDQLLLIGTLYEAAQKKGLVTAVVGKTGAAYMQDRKRGGYILDEKTAWPLSFAQELQKQGFVLPATTPNMYPANAISLATGNGNPTAQVDNVNVTFANGLQAGDPTDASGAKATDANRYLMRTYLEYILPIKKPDISFVWFRDPDSTEHSYGPGSGNYRLALRAQDERLGELRAKLKALHMEQDTNIVIVSDHAHSNVSGSVSNFPLREISQGKVGAPKADGYSVSGDIRSAHLLTLAGFQHVYDGAGCLKSAMAGQRADGSFVYPVLTDREGVCGGTAEKPVTYQTPSYKVPANLPEDAIVIAPNGGSDYYYVRNHSIDTVARVVRFLQGHEQYGAIFVSDKYQGIPGTMPLSRIHLENLAGRNPDIVVSYAWDDQQKINGLPGIEFESFGGSRGMHGSFSPIDVHNTMAAVGPDFQRQFIDPLPSANVDLAPTIARIFGIAMPQADGRPLLEALPNTGVSAGAYGVTNHAISSSTASALPLIMADQVTTKDTPSTHSYEFHLQTKELKYDGKTYLYFDYAKAARQ